MSRHFCAKNIFLDAPSELSSSDLHVYIYLVACSNAKDGLAWPSLESMATDTRLSRATVSRAISALIGAGMVTIPKRTTRKAKSGRGVNMYFLPRVMGDVAPQPDPKPAPKPEPEPEPKPEPQPKPEPKPEAKPKPETEIPAELLAVEGFAAAWADWRTYRKQAKLRPLTPIGVTRQFSAMVKSAGEGVDVVACINKAIAANWQSIHLDTQTKPQPQAIQPTQSDFMRQYIRAVDARFRAEVLEEAPKVGKVLVAIDDEDLPF